MKLLKVKQLLSKLMLYPWYNSWMTLQIIVWNLYSLFARSNWWNEFFNGRIKHIFQKLIDVRMLLPNLKLLIPCTVVNFVNTWSTTKNLPSTLLIDLTIISKFMLILFLFLFFVFWCETCNFKHTYSKKCLSLKIKSNQIHLDLSTASSLDPTDKHPKPSKNSLNPKKRYSELPPL